jgi:hypothetical protein
MSCKRGATYQTLLLRGTPAVPVWFRREIGHNLADLATTDLRSLIVVFVYITTTCTSKTNSTTESSSLLVVTSAAIQRLARAVVSKPTTLVMRSRSV